MIKKYKKKPVVIQAMQYTGDYIIKGVEGEFYPCKPRIFKKTYEELKNG